VCSLYLVLRDLGLGTEANTLISFGLGLALRLCAIWRGWKLPTFSYRQRWD
jgi:uncharacterized membrane protein YeiH